MSAAGRPLQRALDGLLTKAAPPCHAATRGIQLRAMPSTAPPCAIVIFGASGDLAQRKLIPAVYEMAREDLLNDKTYIVGFSRSVMTDEQFRAQAKEAVQKYARTKPVDDAVWKKLESRFFYNAGDYGSADDHAKLGARLAEYD